MNQASLLDMKGQLRKSIDSRQPEIQVSELQHKDRDLLRFRKVVSIVSTLIVASLVMLTIYIFELYQNQSEILGNQITFLTLAFVCLSLLPALLLLYFSNCLENVLVDLRKIEQMEKVEAENRSYLFEELHETVNITKRISKQLRVETARAQDLLETNSELAVHAQTDSLTGLYNRKFFDKIKERYRKAPAHYGLMMIDIDNFKNINDTFGHTGGDEVLQGVAHILKENVSDKDYVIRLGGDEFCIIIFWNSLKSPALLAERLLNEVSQKRFRLKDELVGVNISVGFSYITSSGLEFSFDELYDQADQALYKAKESGKNQFAEYLHPISIND